jgi:D-amino-acid dehydrogenase
MQVNPESLACCAITAINVGGHEGASLQIAVIGAGIIGVTTAYELAADGHEVTVFERLQAVASAASFANAGVVAAGYVSPWAAPWMPLKVAAGLFSRHPAVHLGAGTLAQPRWLSSYLLACRKGPHLANRRRMQGLALYSRERLDTLTRGLDLDYEQRSGYLVLLRGDVEAQRARKGLPLLDQLGVSHQWLEGDAVHQHEPALSRQTKLSAGLWLPNERVGNCRQFAHALKGKAQELGVSFRFGTEVLRLSESHPGGLYWRPTDHLKQAITPQGFDAVVLCTGQLPQSLAGRWAKRIRIQPVFGYSMTATIRHQEAMPDPGPRSGVMDERFKVSITRLGQRVRVAGMAEMGTQADFLREAPLNTLYKVLDDWFPGSVEVSKAQHWKGARPMTADGPPLVGPAGPPKVWLNLGHGSSGWALSCGSARVIADKIGGRIPALDTEGLGIERLL